MYLHKSKLLIFAVFPLIISAFSSIAVCDDSSSPSTSPSTQPSDDDSVLSVDADTLYKAYKSNEVRADAQYGDRVLDVTGIVRRVALDFEHRPFVEIGGGNGVIPAAACDFNSSDSAVLGKIESLNAGDTVVVRGMVHGPFFGDVRLKCTDVNVVNASQK